jgi:hypothetical protein
MDQQKKISIYSNYIEAYNAMILTDYTLALQHLEHQLHRTENDIPTRNLIEVCHQASNINNRSRFNLVFKKMNRYELVKDS